MIDPGVPSSLDLAAVADRYSALTRDVESPASDAWLATLREWDGLRRELKTWSALTQLRFDQNINDDAARKARVARDEVTPKLTAKTISRRSIPSSKTISFANRRCAQNTLRWLPASKSIFTARRSISPR